MKKLYTTPRWKAQSRRRARSELAKRRAKRLFRARRNRAKAGKPRIKAHQRGEFVVVSAPSVFSIIRNPAESIEFLDRLRETFRSGRGVHIDLSGVTQLTSDAVVVLLSQLSDKNFSRGGGYGGNDPAAEGPRSLLNQSGFFGFVRSVRLREPAEGGRIRRKRNTQVQERIADELVAFATTRMVGRAEDRRSSYSTLIECMANTHEHSAKGRHGVNRWWANVYCPPNSPRSFFCVVDNGIGIFRSATVRHLRRRLGGLLGLSGNAALFRDWMEGRIERPSRTGQHYRGKGLLDVRRRLKARKDGMTRVVIVSNDVYADLAEDRFETMPVSFSGTIVYWEIEA